MDEITKEAARISNLMFNRRAEEVAQSLQDDLKNMGIDGFKKLIGSIHDRDIKNQGLDLAIAQGPPGTVNLRLADAYKHDHSLVQFLLSEDTGINLPVPARRSAKSDSEVSVTNNNYQLPEMEFTLDSGATSTVGIGADNTTHITASADTTTPAESSSIQKKREERLMEVFETTPDADGTYWSLDEMQHLPTDEFNRIMRGHIDSRALDYVGDMSLFDLDPDDPADQEVRDKYFEKKDALHALREFQQDRNFQENNGQNPYEPYQSGTDAYDALCDAVGGNVAVGENTLQDIWLLPAGQFEQTVAELRRQIEWTEDRAAIAALDAFIQMRKSLSEPR